MTKRSLYADDQGQASWLRIGTKDQVGIWKVQITRGGTATNMAYSVIRLPVTPTGSKTIGVNFRLYQAPFPTFTTLIMFPAHVQSTFKVT